MRRNSRNESMVKSCEEIIEQLKQEKTSNDSLQDMLRRNPRSANNKYERTRHEDNKTPSYGGRGTSPDRPKSRDNRYNPRPTSNRGRPESSKPAYQKPAYQKPSYGGSNNKKPAYGGKPTKIEEKKPDNPADRFEPGKFLKANPLYNSDQDKQIIAEIEQRIVGDKITTKFDDIGGLEDVKSQLDTNIILPIMVPKIFEGRIKPKAGV